MPRITCADIKGCVPLTSTTPLLSHTSPDRIVAWRDGISVTAAQFLSDVEKLATLLPASHHVLNDCHDRYHFLVAFSAILVSGKVNLLPSTRTAETIRQLLSFAPDAVCLTDQAHCAIDLPRTAYPTSSFFDLVGSSGRNGNTFEFQIPQIENDRLVAYVFTSGSTGLPIAHRKTWATLVRNVQMEAIQLGLQPDVNYSVVGTVPAQHMYGFESTVLMPLVNGFSLTSALSFYPADICSSLEQVPEPRVLVTTPVHLRSLIGSELPLPKIEVMVSATAPLSPQLALQAEQTFHAPLQEIYGSTETGQIASRQPSHSPEWILFPTLKMTRCPHQDASDERMWISGGHVETPMPMNDAIEMTGDGTFLLHGRITDLINIAGKRSSLAYLNHHLNAIPGVVDGAFFMPPEKSTGEVTRLKAFVVAPTLAVSDLIDALRQKIDPAFLPRPLYKVDSLPRNATGKLPQASLAELLHTLAAAPCDTSHS